jgi:hypothetical protein
MAGSTRSAGRCFSASHTGHGDQLPRPEPSWSGPACSQQGRAGCGNDGCRAGAVQCAPRAEVELSNARTMGRAGAVRRARDRAELDATIAAVLAGATVLSWSCPTRAPQGRAGAVRKGATRPELGAAMAAALDAYSGPTRSPIPESIDHRFRRGRSPERSVKLGCSVPVSPLHDWWERPSRDLGGAKEWEGQEVTGGDRPSPEWVIDPAGIGTWSAPGLSWSRNDGAALPAALPF